MFERLASFARLIRFDKRGTGMSDQVSAATPLETRMDDVRAVMDAVGSERAAMVGVSEGAPMSLLFAATYPDRAWALALYGGFARELRAHDYPWGLSEAEYLDALKRLPDRSKPEEREARARRASPGAPDEEIAALAKFFQ
jgi:pimeloyl-ACP methyl ester carboxylesterase